MTTIAHTVKITEEHSEDGVRVDVVFTPADLDYSQGVTPGFVIGAAIVKAFRSGDLQRLTDKYIHEAK